MLKFSSAAVLRLSAVKGVKDERERADAGCREERDYRLSAGGRGVPHRGPGRKRDCLANAGAKSCKTSVAKSSLLDFMTELQPIARSANGGVVWHVTNKYR